MFFFFFLVQVSGCADIEHSPKKLAVSMLNLREEADNVSTHPPLSACNALDSIKARFLQRWGLGPGCSHCPPISILSKTLYRSRASAKVISFQTAPLRDAKMCKAHFRGDPSQSRASGIVMSSSAEPCIHILRASKATRKVSTRQIVRCQWRPWALE